MTPTVAAPQASGSRRPIHDRRLPLICNKTVTTDDGVKLAVRDYGSPAAVRTIVLLHGFCLSKESWNIQVAQLINRWRNNIRIISYDHRGHGASAGAPMRTYRIDQLADDLAGLLVALDVRAPLTLVGHSMGGMTALAYLARPAASRPVDPDGLVLIATAAGKLAERGLGRLMATPATEIFYQLVRHAPRAGAEKAIRALALPVCGALARYGGYGSTRHAASVAASAAAINATPLPTKAGFLYGLKTYDQYHTLPSVTATTTVISGGADPLTPPSHARDLAAGIPGATLIHEPAAGHMLLHEFPGVVTEAIDKVSAGRRLPPPAGPLVVSAAQISTRSRVA